MLWPCKASATAGWSVTSNGSAPRNAGEVLTTADVCFEVVTPATAARQCSFAELDAAPGESGPATAFVSHAWLYPFEWLVSALEAAKICSTSLSSASVFADSTKYDARAVSASAIKRLSHA